MSSILHLLVALGFTAAAWRLGRASFRVARWGAHGFAAGEQAVLRARRGDLTGMADADRRAGEAKRARRRSLALAAGWLIVLVVPSVLGAAWQLYAAYVLLWLVPGRF